jgi:hypothetical protein
MVLTPEGSGSPFEVYEDKSASTKQRKSAEALDGLGKAHGKTRPDNRSLIGMLEDVTETDSVHDKPSL